MYYNANTGVFNMNQLRVVKIIVFVLSFLLIFGTLLMVAALFSKSARKTALPSEISLNEPVGSSIVEILSNNKRLYILVKDGGLPDRIVIFDTKNGEVASKIRLNGK